jgi:hypothetical protein
VTPVCSVEFIVHSKKLTFDRYQKSISTARRVVSLVNGLAK